MDWNIWLNFTTLAVSLLLIYSHHTFLSLPYGGVINDPASGSSAISGTSLLTFLHKWVSGQQIPSSPTHSPAFVFRRGLRFSFILSVWWTQCTPSDLGLATPTQQLSERRLLMKTYKHGKHEEVGNFRPYVALVLQFNPVINVIKIWAWLSVTLRLLALRYSNQDDKTKKGPVGNIQKLMKLWV